MKHIHRLQLFLWGKKKTPIYKCVKPGCNYYKELNLAVGALTECNRCFTEAIAISKKDIRRRIVKPHCVDCTRGQKHKKKEDIDSALAALLEGL